MRNLVHPGERSAVGQEGPLAKVQASSTHVLTWILPHIRVLAEGRQLVFPALLPHGKKLPGAVVVLGWGWGTEWVAYQ